MDKQDIWAMNYDLSTLDFDAVQRLLETYARTPYGAEAARNLAPPAELAVARSMQRAVTAAREAIEAGDSIPLATVPNIHPALRQAAADGSILHPKALLNIREVMEMAAGLLPVLHKYPPLFAQDLSQLTPVPALLERLQGSVSHKGLVRPEASEELRAAWSQYVRAKQLAEEQVQQLTGRESIKVALVADRPLYWQGARLLFVVRADAIDAVKGVRRGSLMDPAQKLVEPIELVAANNHMERMHAQIHVEEQRVLRDLSAEVGKHQHSLAAMLDAITWIDLAQAGGQLSAQLGAHAPQLSESPELHLDNAYHPLLIMQYIQGTLDRPVPLTLRLSKRQPFLLVSGPNAGGKTIALKTVGLLALMALCGLHIPAEGDCTIGWFDAVLVDLGDRQSVYHHLSTFAAHVEMMKRMLGHAGPSSLMLFDELGSGTDPDEGAALAMAMLDELVRKGCLGIVNTHLPPLKDYAASRSKVQNACMMFDQATLAPTFRLKVGEAGQSYGLVIAENNGLPSEVIDNARTYLQSLQGAAWREEELPATGTE